MSKQETAKTPKSGRDLFIQSLYPRYVSHVFPPADRRTLERVRAMAPLCGDQRGRLLSIGAGNLTEPRALREHGFTVTVGDVVAEMMEQAVTEGFETLLVDLDGPDPIPGRYECICCMGVLEHLVNPLMAIGKLMEAMVPGGKLFVSLPDEFHLLARLRILGGRPGFNHYNWHHLRFFNLKAAHERFDAAGVRIVRTVHLPLVPPHRLVKLRRLWQGLANAWPSLFAAGHLFLLENKNEP